MNYFDENGDTSEEVWESLNQSLREGRTLRDKDAVLLLAEVFAGTTHGNYCAETMFTRANNFLTNSFNVSVDTREIPK